MVVSIKPESREIPKRTDWATPLVVYQIIDLLYGPFTLDPCASAGNAKCDKFFTVDDDGLAQSWAGNSCWLNPPYGKELPLWAEKGVREMDENGVYSVFLIPPRVGTPWFQELCKRAREVRFLRGRVPFVDPAGNRTSPQDDNCIVILDPKLNSPAHETWFTFWDWKESILLNFGADALREVLPSYKEAA